MPLTDMQRVEVPGSKSYTNRALIMAALTKGPVCLKNPLYSDDTEAMIGCLRALGLKIDTEPTHLVVHTDIQSVLNQYYELFVSASGTTARFILALSCIIPGVQLIFGTKRLNERPIQDLVEGLRQLGAVIDYVDTEGKLPVKVSSSSLVGPQVNLRGDISSQFCSALLLISPFISKGLTIHVLGPLISKPYVNMTLSVMKDWGVEVIGSENGDYTIPEHQSYQMKDWSIEGDFSSASYFFALAVLKQKKIRVENLNPTSIQADRQFLTILENMGNKVSFDDNSVSIEGSLLLPVDVNMEGCPDQVMTLAVLATFAKGITKISGVRSLRYKETERIMALKTELGKMGIKVEDTYDTLTIYGGSPHAALIQTYNDHRMAMAFGLAALELPGMVIQNPEVVRKTFPPFWTALKCLT